MPSNQKCPRDPIHGNIYQLKLLMLFLYQGINHKYYFDLGTEIPEAKKFDDIVFGYKEQNEFKFRLLQAKHRIDESKKIKAEDLFTNNDTNFSLTKYYFSYHECKREKLFKNGSIKDIIICTNIDFDLSDLEKAGITLDPVEESDPILDINNTELPINKQPARYKFNPRISSKLKDVIENSFIPQLARKLASFLLNGKTISREGYLFGLYQYVLRKEVIDVVNKRFKEDFIQNNNLSKDAENFRNRLHNEILIQSKEIIKMEDLNNDITEKKTINEKTIGLAVRKDFGKGTPPNENWPETSVSIDDIDEFLRVLVFAVNQLNEEELGQVIMKEIGNEFNRITTEYVYNKIFQRMLSWMQGKDSDGERKGHSLHSWEEGQSLFNDARKEILNCLAPDRKVELESIPFCFNRHEEVVDFLNSDHSIWLLVSEAPWLSRLVVYHSVKSIHKISHHFFNLSDAVSNNGEIISDFQDLDDFLIVLTCNKITNTEEIGDNFDLKLQRNSRNSKKIIIITPVNETLISTLKQKISIDYERKIKIEFGSLDDASKDRLLINENIIFNGNPKKLCLNRLLCSHDQIRDLTLDAAEIELLIRNSEVEMWNEGPRQLNLSSINYKANEIVSSNHIIKAMKLNKMDIFAFSGNQNDARNLVLNENEDLQEFRCEDLSNLLQTHHFFFMNDGEEREEFHLLCQVASNVCELKPSVHKLKSLGNDEWLWMQTYSQNIYIWRYFKPHLLHNFVVQSICYPQSSQFIIFSGMMENKLLNLLPEKYRSHERFYNYRVVISKEKAEEEFNRMKQQYEDEFNSAARDFTQDDMSESFHDRGVLWLNAWEEEGNLMLELYQFFGNLNYIRFYLISHDRFLPENSLIKLKQRVIVLSDNTGMGKSSTLNRLAENLRKTNPLLIVIKLDLNDIQEELTLFYEYTKSKLIRTLLNIKPKSKHSSLSGKILEHKLEYLEQVFVLCDAFDELTEDEQENLLKWFDFILQITKASIWITTRPINKAKLEKHFSVLSYSFKTLKKNEQIDYLNRFWKMSLTFSGVNQNVSDFSSIANEVTEHFKSVLVKRQNESFVQIPLMLRMLAENFVEVVRNSSMNVNSLQVETINCLSTYKSFVDHVFEIYFFDKIKTIKGLDDDSKIVLKNAYFKAYGQLALRHICARLLRDPVIYLGNKAEAISLNTLSRIGLIQSHGGLITKSMFIHPSFEEYFAVNTVFNKLKSNQKCYIWWELLLNVILMHTFSRRIFDDKLKNNELLPNNEAISIISRILRKQVRNKSERVALWMAAADDLKQTVYLLSNGMRSSEMEQILQLKKNTIPTNALQFQVYSSDDQTLALIIESGKILFEKRDLKSLIQKINFT